MTIFLVQFPFAVTNQCCLSSWLWFYVDTIIWYSQEVPRLFEEVWDQKLSSGLMLLTFMTNRLFQIRFADTEQ